MTDQSDWALIEKAIQNDVRAFEVIVRRYESRVAATVIGMLGPGPDSDDIGQETFIRFYKGLRSFRGDSSVGTFLTRIAINLSLNELKRRKRRRFLSFSDTSQDPAQIPDSVTEAGYNEEKEIIQKGLQKLDPKFRSVIVLRLIDGYSTRETADILSIPSGTVLSRLARAQEKLKIYLKPILEGDDG